MEIPVRIIKYWAIFTFSYAGALGVVNAAFYIMDISGNGGVNSGILLFSIVAAVSAFCIDHQRAPDKVERKRLAKASLLSSILVSGIIAHILLLLENHSLFSLIAEISDRITPILFGVALIIFILFYYLIIGFMYWFFGKIALKICVK